MSEKIKITRKGYEKLQQDLEHLKTVRRDEIAANMGTALADGDLRESAAYDEARMQQSENEAKIADLEEQLNRSVIISTEEQKGITIGAKVEVHDQQQDRLHIFEIVGTYEVDVYKTKDVKKISEKSPIGEQLQGKDVGDMVAVQTPKGILKYKILSVRYTD